jgi:hypothetical protein
MSSSGIEIRRLVFLEMTSEPQMRKALIRKNRCARSARCLRSEAIGLTKFRGDDLKTATSAARRV